MLFGALLPQLVTFLKWTVWSGALFPQFAISFRLDDSVVWYTVFQLILFKLDGSVVCRTVPQLVILLKLDDSDIQFTVPQLVTLSESPNLLHY